MRLNWSSLSLHPNIMVKFFRNSSIYLSQIRPYFHLFLNQYFKNWSIVGLQCCVNVCYTAQWFELYAYLHSFYIIFYCDLSWNIEYSRTLLMIHSVYDSLHLLSPAPILSLPRPPPSWQPPVCSLCLWFSVS